MLSLSNIWLIMEPPLYWTIFVSHRWFPVLVIFSNSNSNWITRRTLLLCETLLPNDVWGFCSRRNFFVCFVFKWIESGKFYFYYNISNNYLLSKFQTFSTFPAHLNELKKKSATKWSERVMKMVDWNIGSMDFGQTELPAGQMLILTKISTHSGLFQ